jgi:hypothetical protein
LSDTISVRIPHNVKKRLQELDVNLSEVVRTCLINIIQREENLEKLEDVDQELRSRTSRPPKGTADTLVREDRDLEH